MHFKHNNLKSTYKTPFGCIRQDEVCTISLEFYDIELHSAKLIIEHENGNFHRCIPMEKVSENKYTVLFKERSLGLYYYYFTVNDSINIYKDDYFGATTNSYNKWQLTCYDKNYDTSEDFKGKVFYQIFPDRFYQYDCCNTDNKLQPFFIHSNKNEPPVFKPNSDGIVENCDFYGGNLKGISQKIPYLKDLGVSVIYLNPICKAYSNHRYDTADYLKIDELLGTEQDFVDLCNNAHINGIKIILDGVFSHTGCNSVYFDKYKIFGNGAYDNKNSPYFNWFQFFENSQTEYNSWWGIDTLPCTDENNIDFQSFIFEKVIPYWINLGADGIRLDVADELPDEFIKKLNDKVKSLKPNSIIIGEVWEDASNKISYSNRRKYFTNLELDSTMNYPFRDSIIKLVRENISVKDFVYSIMTIVEHYPKPVLDCVMNSLSTHDTIRILTNISDIDFNISRDEKSVYKLPDDIFIQSLKRLKLAVFLQFTFSGCACIYYGDEIGMQGFEDPFNREFFKWDNINNDILNYYKKMSELKNNIKAFQIGTFAINDFSQHSFSFTRKYKDSEYICVVSLNENHLYYYNGDVICSENTIISNKTITINKYGYAIIKIN